jgi:hypothetical protein
LEVDVLADVEEGNGTFQNVFGQGKHPIGIGRYGLPNISKGKRNYGMGNGISCFIGQNPMFFLSPKEDGKTEKKACKFVPHLPIKT